MTINFGKNVETQKMAVNGWNWGKVSFGGKIIEIENMITNIFFFL